ncbi:MAG TPA: depupylase/deamidase Dop [Nitrospira sp.]|jgi:proteasome accessory factor A|nr:proteasome accessory factor PafA2 [Nitrospira sp.]MBS0177201.1 proteasome accessory factor PafA2 [Nitrospira sp.]HNA27125.1 depupylase/deamidase Dop [Nitrospira sp.]HNI68081.1 depupylase/deamidase Dop [Nitrospira sp.]HNK13112.1 depupylase/deamidase Dop [Nitrospira sp.]
MSDTHSHSPARVIGTETEFGIASRDPNATDPVANSIHLIGHYPNLPAPQAVWDYENENPLLDARGFEVDGERERPGPDYNRQLNKVLANGGRLYVDGAHPEYSTPECTNAREVVAFERVGERIVAQAQAHITKERGRDQFVLYKNNSDGKGNSYGYHENYLVARSVPFERITQVLTPFLVTRPIFAGSGKVGAENGTSPADYQISQRADFFETLVDLNTMVRRPIINTRDEPHSDSAKYRRLHVIVGDANMAELSTYLKVGTLSIVLELLEAGAELPKINLEDPVNTIKQVSRDMRVQESLKLTDGTSSTAIAVQRAYLKAAQGYFACHELNQVTKDVLVRWEDVLDRLEKDPRSLVRELDWVAKRYLIESYMDRKSCGWDDPRVRLMDFQYHDVRPEKGLYYTLERSHLIERIVLDHEIARAEMNPPVGTRAFFRGQCVRKYPNVVYGASWTSVLFDIGQNKIKKIPLMDPLRGTEALTGELLAQAETAAALLAKLSS